MTGAADAGLLLDQKHGVGVATGAEGGGCEACGDLGAVECRRGKAYGVKMQKLAYQG